MNIEEKYRVVNAHGQKVVIDNGGRCLGSLDEIVDRLTESNSAEFVSMSSAPRDRTSIHLKFKDDLSQYYGAFEEKMKRWEGVQLIARFDGFDLDKHDHFDTFAFAAPVGQGGFHASWFEGWMPLPTPSAEDK